MHVSEHISGIYCCRLIQLQASDSQDHRQIFELISGALDLNCVHRNNAGTWTQVVELPIPLKMDDLLSSMEREFGHNNAAVRHRPAVAWKLAILAGSGRHFPKKDRAGLCDSYCKATIMDTRFR